MHSPCRPMNRHNPCHVAPLLSVCVNMCKLPTQKFFTETFGLPLTMGAQRP